MPFKWIGRKLLFLESLQGKIAAIIPLLFFVYAVMSAGSFAESMYTVIPIISVGIALLLVLYAFSSRRSALTAWGYLVLAHFFILWGIMANTESIIWEQTIMYANGITVAGIVGFISLQKIYGIDKDVSLNHFHGYVYEQKTTALVFLLSSIGLLGFPITAAFVGIDVFFTHIHADQTLLIILTALSFLFIELAAIRIYCRIFLGLHKKLNHPVAFRSS